MHWRFSEDVCEGTRSEVSPKARKRGGGSRVVEIGANRQSCDPSVSLMLKLVLDVVKGVAACFHGKDYTRGEHWIPGKSED